jgi:hypothetical protein
MKFIVLGCFILSYPYAQNIISSTNSQFFLNKCIDTEKHISFMYKYKSLEDIFIHFIVMIELQPTFTHKET